MGVKTSQLGGSTGTPTCLTRINTCSLSDFGLRAGDEAMMDISSAWTLASEISCDGGGRRSCPDRNRRKKEASAFRTLRRKGRRGRLICGTGAGEFMRLDTDRVEARRSCGVRLEDNWRDWDFLRIVGGAAGEGSSGSG